MSWMLTSLHGVLSAQTALLTAHGSQVGRIHLQILPGKYRAPGVREHVAAGLLNIIATSQGKCYLCIPFEE